jgi:hypothetical protein
MEGTCPHSSFLVTVKARHRIWFGASVRTHFRIERQITPHPQCHFVAVTQQTRLVAGKDSGSRIADFCSPSRFGLVQAVVSQSCVWMRGRPKSHKQQGNGGGLVLAGSTRGSCATNLSGQTNHTPHGPSCLLNGDNLVRARCKGPTDSSQAQSRPQKPWAATQTVDRVGPYKYYTIIRSFAFQRPLRC